MLHILLSILAVIVKILLILLGVILLIILLVLFVPIRYKVTFRKQEKELEGLVGVSWLLKLINVKAGYREKKLDLEVFLFGIPLLRLLKWIRERKLGSRKKQKKTESEQTDTSVIESAEAIQPEPEEILTIEEKSDQPEPAEKEQERSEETKEAESVASEVIGSEAEPERAEVSETETEPLKEEAEPVQKESSLKKIFRKIGSVIRKILGIPKTVVKKLEAVVEKLKAISIKVNGILDKVKEVVEFLKTDMFKEIFAVVRREVIAIIRSILPRKIWGRIEFGMDDPGTTGEILAVIGMLYPILPERLVICPDFDEAVLNTDVSLKGRIWLIELIFHAVKIVLNKQVRRLIKKLLHKGA